MSPPGVLRDTATEPAVDEELARPSAFHAGDTPAQHSSPHGDRTRPQSRESVAQRSWAAAGFAARLKVLGRARGLMAARAQQFSDAISSELNRTPAETLVAEWMPLLAACRYLEHEAATVLRTRRPGRRGRPLWLAGVKAEVERVPFGTVLIIGPSNYPLLLPGVQTLQALAAGNAVLWKPGRGGKAVAQLMAAALHEAGLPAGLLDVLDESVEAATAALHSGKVSKVFFTGSAAAAREVLRQAAESATPCVVELSGSDAVVVLPTADLSRVARALGFGLRLNGSATCMAPRRLLLVGAGPAQREELVTLLTQELASLEPVRVPAATLASVHRLLQESIAEGATLLGGSIDLAQGTMQPALVLDGTPGMRIAQVDVFAPVLTVITLPETEAVREAQAQCPLGLTASIFGDENAARALARELEVGTVLINDVIVPTADPRLPFGGRRGSGFGTTRGAEGLLEMTAPRVVSVRPANAGMRHYDRTGASHASLFAALGAGLYAGTLAARWSGWSRVIAAGRTLARAAKTAKR